MRRKLGTERQGHLGDSHSDELVQVIGFVFQDFLHEVVGKSGSDLLAGERSLVAVDGRVGRARLVGPIAHVEAARKWGLASNGERRGQLVMARTFPRGADGVGGEIDAVGPVVSGEADVDLSVFLLDGGDAKVESLQVGGVTRLKKSTDGRRPRKEACTARV